MKKNSSRRSVMRAALAAGCSLWMPIAFSAADAKTATKTFGTPATSETVKKVPQASVQYQTKPKGDQKCATCVNFIVASNTCKLVEGQISPEGWCTLWVKMT